MATSLLDWIIDLMRNDSARESFNANPQAAMASAGFSSVCGEDVADSRAFLFDNPSIQEVKGVDTPQKSFEDTSSAPDKITYIVNNYTYEAPAVAGADQFNDVDDAPVNGVSGANGLNGVNGANGLNTVTAVPVDNGPTTQSGTGNTLTTTQDVDTTSNSTDNSTDTDSEAHNVVSGAGSAGEDQIIGNTANESTNVLTFTDLVDTGDVDVLSKLVDDSLDQNSILNGSLNGSLNELAKDSLNNNDLSDLIDILA